MPGMFGAGRGPGGGRGPEGGNGRGPRATIRGPGGQEIQPPNLNDPAVQARLRPYLQLADRVRALPPQQYEQQKARLAAQLDAAERQARREQEARREISFDEALNAIVDAYLLNPRAPGVIKVRLGKA